MSNRTVLILTNNDIGLYKFRLELIEKLLSNCWNINIALPNGDFIKDFTSLGCQFINIEFNRRGQSIKEDLSLLCKYIKILKHVKPDAVLTYTIKPNIYGNIACALLGIPCISNVTGLGTAIENGGLLSKFLTILYKVAFIKTKRVFVQNEENKMFFIKNNIAKDCLKLIPGSGVNIDKFNIIPYPKSEKKLEFVFISRIMKEKGIDEYLEAAKIVKEKHPDFVFHVCGSMEPEYKGMLEEYTQKGIVHYHGMLKDIKSILKYVHCVVHPTYYPEGMSNVLLESCASARPIITTNRAGCREVIDDEINGFVVEQQNSEDLVEKIEKFIALPYEEKVKMGLSGRAKVEKDFDRNIVIKAYLEELKGINYDSNC